MEYLDLHIRVQELIRKASSFYDMPFSPPKILVDLTGADAGQAIPESNLLRFNLHFLRYNRSHFLKHIAAHETAHIVAPKVYGHRIAAHGEEWQGVMNRVFKVPAERLHSYDLRQTGRYRFIYNCRCPKKETPLSAIRHNRRKRGVIYYCSDCGARLRFLYEDKKPFRAV
ncbi:SprT-like domain-containing protein [Sansalvadorimonas sp. 2012CJ34-2]|uniref:SprT-like domain-containing protein n=1 Tax=Parendozoicomonas callyspongiae TaxID=2942213 RepID=A0ABT0PJB6_9GAMM|nr:SprT-like domain-containing protein [Sansalvadorimonas sp. 2012CJ34-2]MCL6271480.1 SprT-like domain-containing protein [Sansalvadorimonas sp. 2012CJ34-2]